MSGDQLAQRPAPAALSALRRYRAERMLRRDFNGLRARVLKVVASRLRATGVALDRGDLEACYATAWHGLYSAIASGEEIGDAAAWLILVTFRRAIDEGRSRARRGLGGASLDAPGRSRARVAMAEREREAPEVLADKARLRQLFEALLARMSPREREAVSLCYLQGLSRAEAAARMGISPNRMRKLMDGGEGRAGAASKFGQLTRTVGAGGWCEQQGSLMRAYALGLLDPEGERHRLAVAHVRQCPACRRWVACLRGLAALLPPPAPPRPAGAPSRPSFATKETYLRLRPHAGGGFVAKLAAIVAITAATVGAGYELLVNGANAHTPSAGARTSPSARTAESSRERARAPRPVHRRLQEPRRRRRSAVARRASAAVEPAPSTAPTLVSAPPSKPSSPGGEFTPEQVGRSRG